MEKIPVLVILICMYMFHVERCPAIPSMPQGSLLQTAQVLFPIWAGDHVVAWSPVSFCLWEQMTVA